MKLKKESYSICSNVHLSAAVFGNTYCTTALLCVVLGDSNSMLSYQSWAFACHATAVASVYQRRPFGKTCFEKVHVFYLEKQLSVL